MSTTTNQISDSWLADFIAARTFVKRRKVVSRLSLRLSGGWRSVLTQARDIAETDNQTTLARQLAARLAGVDAPCEADLTVKTWHCFHCEQALPVAAFGKNPLRRARVRKLQPHHVPEYRAKFQDWVEECRAAGWHAIVKRQSNCTSCRNR